MTAIPTRATSLTWIATGTQLFTRVAGSLDDASLRQASSLPGWSRGHVLGHVGLNAEALCNLVGWAATGVERLMYESAERRSSEIESSAVRGANILFDVVVDTAERLDQAMAELDDEAWNRNVRTSSGRSVSAEEIPWMRVRELFVHAVDLGAGVGFDDLPDDVCEALISDIAAFRSRRGTDPAVRLTSGRLTWAIDGQGAAIEIGGSTPAIAAWISGRSDGTALAVDDGPLPLLRAWL